MPFSVKYFLEVCAQFPLKVVTKDSSRHKNAKNFIISDAKILKVKTKECAQNNFCFSHHFRTFLPSSEKALWGVSAQASPEL